MPCLSNLLGRGTLQGTLMVEHCQEDLFHVVDRLCPPGSLAGRLHGREQECNQDTDGGHRGHLARSYCRYWKASGSVRCAPGERLQHSLG